jgi:hypothetical protein
MGDDLRDTLRLVEKPLSLDLFLANAMGLVPVQLHTSDATVLETNHSDSLQLAPSTPAILTLESANLAGRAAGRDRLHVDEVTNDLEVRHRILALMIDGARDYWLLIAGEPAHGGPPEEQGP